MDTKGTVATTSTDAPTAPIEFGGRKIMTYLPNEAQMAVIARLSYWDRNVGKEDVQKLRAGINRVGTLLAGLMVEQDDWDFIEDGMAAREFTWEEVLGIFDLLADAHGLGNRATRRAAKSTASRARRG